MNISRNSLVVGINIKGLRFFGIVTGGCQEDGYQIKTINPDGSDGIIVGCLAKDITHLGQVKEGTKVDITVFYKIMMDLTRIAEAIKPVYQKYGECTY